MPSIQNGIVTMDMSWFFGVLVALQGFGGLVIWFLLQRAFSLHGEKATLQAEGTLKQGTIAKLEIENTKLKEHIAELEKTIKEKYSDDAILAKYEINKDIAIHKDTKIPHCLGCLMKRPRQEVVLIDSDTYWSCPIERQNHDSPNKPGRRRWPEVSAPDGPFY